MTAKETAFDLVEKYRISIMDKEGIVDYHSVFRAKVYAGICVDEIIDACEFNNVESHNTRWWQDVKKEIELL